MDPLTLRPAFAPLPVSARLVLSHRDVATPHLESTHTVAIPLDECAVAAYTSCIIHTESHRPERCSGRTDLYDSGMIHCLHKPNHPSPAQAMTQPYSGSRSIVFAAMPLQRGFAALADYLTGRPHLSRCLSSLACIHLSV
ncbi:hypothetical protein PMIN01_00271 [Paraphaeosphaeria minitans]|uniref:Uncharacterized protein n=1 Tax=Paraphaeosphaeria minitans TaxID=565426 RepID=A0A9P6GRV5_9PLEO|nr:hypothetical protein PMIN01_00271 [Paraphaeosphaeria minitans]